MQFLFHFVSKEKFGIMKGKYFITLIIMFGLRVVNLPLPSIVLAFVINIFFSPKQGWLGGLR